MTSQLFDHHIHSDRSDGTVSLGDRAKTVAIRPHGVSDHYPWRDKLPNEDAVKRYIDDATKLGLRVGIEYDLGVAPPLSRATRDALQYVIGAIHNLVVDGELIRYDDAGANATRSAEYELFDRTIASLDSRSPRRARSSVVERSAPAPAPMVQTRSRRFSWTIRESS